MTGPPLQEQIARLRARCLDPSHARAVAAIEALGKLGGAEAAVALMALLGMVETEHLSGEICAALGATQSAEALAALSRRASSRDLHERESAIAGLVQLELPEVIPHLGVALRAVLAEIEPFTGSEGTPVAPDTYARLERQGTSIIAALGRRATFPMCRSLQDALHSPSAEIRMHAALAMAEVAERDPDPRFVQIVKVLAGELPPWTFHWPRRQRGFRAAMDRISRAIASHGDRPIPSEPPAPDASTLPRPDYDE